MQQTFEADVRSLAETDARLASLDQALAELASQALYRTPVAALRCLKGIDTLSALTLVVEVQDFHRFATAAAFMSVTDLVPSEAIS